MTYKIKAKKKSDGVIRKTKIRVLGADNKFHNLWADGYGKFFYYHAKNYSKKIERVWIK